MSTQIWLVCSCPQSDQDWLPFYYSSQGQSRCCEAGDGDHARQPEAQPFCLLSQLHEFCGLLREQQAQSHRISKPPSSDCMSIPPRHNERPLSMHCFALRNSQSPLALVLDVTCSLWKSLQASHNKTLGRIQILRGVFNSSFLILKALRCTNWWICSNYWLV